MLLNEKRCENNKSHKISNNELSRQSLRLSEEVELKQSITPYENHLQILHHLLPIHILIKERIRIYSLEDQCSQSKIFLISHLFVLQD